MQWLQLYQNRVDYVYLQAKRQINDFPAPSAQLGLSMLEKIDQSREVHKDNHICCLLPYWLSECLQVSEDDCDQLALGNLFGMMHYFIIDDVMDSPSNLHSHLLPLAGLCNLQLMNRYQALLAGHSAVWQHYGRYVSDWASAVSTERSLERPWNDLRSLAHKSSPLKLTAAALCALSDQEELLEEAELAIDLVLATLQLSDDLADWEIDLEEGNRNAWLSLIRAERSISDEEWTDDYVRQAIYTTDAMEAYLSCAQSHHNQLSKLSISHRSASLTSFHYYLIDDLRRIADQISKDRRHRLEGGLHYWLQQESKNM